MTGQQGLWFLAIVAVLGLCYAGYSSYSLGLRLAASEAALARALADQRDFETRLAAVQLPSPAPAAAAACECEAPEPGIAATVIVAPDGQLLATEAERADYVREQLERRIEASFPADEMDGATREAVLDLLVRVRALRASQTRVAVNDPMPSAERDALIDAQEEIADLTGMGVGELLRELDRGAPARSLTPDEAAAVAEGSERKRFPDEIARMLGITEPGSTEVLRDGVWEAAPQPGLEPPE